MKREEKKRIRQSRRQDVQQRENLEGKAGDRKQRLQNENSSHAEIRIQGKKVITGRGGEGGRRRRQKCMKRERETERDREERKE